MFTSEGYNGIESKLPCTSTPEFLFKQNTVTNGYSNCRYNIFGDRMKQWFFFRFVLRRNTGKVTSKWSWGMKLQCWGTPLFWFLQSDSDQVAKFVPKRQKQPSFGRNPPRVYFTCFSLIYQKHRFEVDPVNCSIKPTSQEAKQLNSPCTPRTSGASLSQTFFEDLGAQRRHHATVASLQTKNQTRICPNIWETFANCQTSWPKNWPLSRILYSNSRIEAI